MTTDGAGLGALAGLNWDRGGGDSQRRQLGRAASVRGDGEGLSSLSSVRAGTGGLPRLVPPWLSAEEEHTNRKLRNNWIQKK